VTFKEYYGEPFRSDLRAVVAVCLPDHSDGDEIRIQPRTLSTANEVIRAWAPDRLNVFAAALFFTILVDQVAYTHFRHVYSRFRALTRYPKFCGDCPGGCNYHLNARSIFNALRSNAGPATGWSGRFTLLEESVEVMHAEVLDFFSHHLTSVSGEEFWRECLAEVPSGERRSGLA
jgi:hypothetical protein